MQTMRCKNGRRRKWMVLVSAIVIFPMRIEAFVVADVAPFVRIVGVEIVNRKRAARVFRHQLASSAFSSDTIASVIGELVLTACSKLASSALLRSARSSLDAFSASVLRSIWAFAEASAFSVTLLAS